jgi:peptidoglycan/xylan/chitin deacetylase (PgdA/CDA1 family)
MMTDISKGFSYISRLRLKAYCDPDKGQSLVFVVLCIAALLSIYHINNPSSQESDEKTGSIKRCSCVVFRMDDVQDDFVDSAQVAAMNIFIERNQSLSLGIIMNDIGKDLRITGKVGEGSQIGLFEMGIHGWDHIDYTKLPESEQRASLSMANEKMKSIFGNISEIFVPPYGYFDNNTLLAMDQEGIRILSAALFSELNFDRGNSIFNYSDPSNKYGNNTLDVFNSAPIHVPALVAYKEYENGIPIKNSTDLILEGIRENIQRYGYSVVVFHPQDFVNTNADGRIAEGNRLNITEVNEFAQLVDSVLSNNLRITTLSEVVGVERRNYSYFN